MDDTAAVKRIREDRTGMPVRVLALSVILLIALQVAGAVLIADETYANAGALAAASKAFYEKSFVLSAPVMSIWALLSRLCMMQPLAFIFTVTPFVVIPGCYFIYALLARKLFARPENRWFMLLCICLLNLWGYQSEYMAPYTLLVSWYTGTALIVHGLLPFAAYKLADRLRIKDKEPLDDAGAGSGEAVDDYYKEEEEDMKNHKIINARNLAVALLVVVIMLIGSVYIMNRKINSLYETTVNLQQQVEELRSR